MKVRIYLLQYVCLLILISILLFRLYAFTGYSNKIKLMKRKDSKYEKSNYAMTFFNRLSNLQVQCKIHGNIESKTLPRLHTAKKNNLRYCKVPKSGSTFWMNVFIIINQKVDEQSSFGKLRDLLHTAGKRFMTKTNLTTFSNHDTIVIVARDPFSRIYSAYVDKIYLPGYWKFMSPQIPDICERGNSFDSFVDFIVRNKMNKILLDEHWAPISELCNPCRIPYNYILKQETFKEDVEFVLDQTDIHNVYRNRILEGLRGKRVEFSIEEVLKEKVSFLSKNKGTCLTLVDLTKRLWKSFQIQGYISDRVSFPEVQFSSLNFTSIKQMKDLYMDGVNQYKLTKIEKMAQRQQYLQQAYKSLSNKSLQNFIKVFDSDFRLFNYSFVPPHIQPSEE